MRNWSAHAAVLLCALLCSGARAQQPADAAAQAQESLAALTAPPPEGTAPADAAKARAAAAAALVEAIEGKTVPDAALRKIDVGAAAVLLGGDAVARDALIAAATGRRTTALRWWAPLRTLMRDPQRPGALVAPAVRCLGAAAWPKLVDEVVADFEDAAAPVEARVRAVHAAGALARFDLPKWGPVGALVKTLSDGLEPLREAAEQELERLLLLDAATPPADLRRWWDTAKLEAPSAVWRERASAAMRAARAQRESSKQELIALLPHLGVAGLVTALASEFEAVRRSAADQLRTRPDPERKALAPLTERLDTEPAVAVREVIVAAIGARLQPGDTAVLQRLATLAAVGSERHPSVRRAAVQALARTPVAASAPAILTALVADTSPVVREAAAEALTGFGPHVSVAAVAKALSVETEPAVGVRVAVARTLGKLGEAPGGDAGACRPLAQAARSDPDAKVRWQAIFALGNVVCEGTEAVDAMAHALRPGEAPKVRKLAAGQLGKRKNAKELDRIAALLAKTLGDDDGEVAAAAGDSLRRLGGEDGYRLWDFAQKADDAGQLAIAAGLGEAALRVVRNGGSKNPLNELDQLKVRMWLVAQWQRVGKPGEAIEHAQWWYEQQPTIDLARKITELAVQAGKFTVGMVNVREAAERFPDQADNLKAFGAGLLQARVAESLETLEIAGHEALAELGELPAEAVWTRDYLAAAAETARELAAAAQDDAAARNQLHERMAGPTGAVLWGAVEACLRRIAAEHALGLQADAALRAAGAERFPPPKLGAPAPDWTAEQRRQLASEWSNAWRQVKERLTKE
ncbi:MAG: HEAT repeat domain-containing protein [Planctomycetota bacterium]